MPDDRPNIATNETGEWVTRPMNDAEYEQHLADAESSELNFDFIRSQRNGLLAGSDWTQVADSPLPDEKKAEWATYRQELRDHLAQSDRVSTMPEWPTQPE